MTYLPNTDFLIEVAKGNVSGHSLIHKFGRNDAVANGAWELISLESAAVSFRTSASTVRVKAGGNAADDAAGSGARSVVVTGIDSNLDEVAETLTTAGASASSASTASFWRIYRAYVGATGTYGANNTDPIIIEDSGGAADMITIAAGEGQSQHGAYTVPSGFTAYVFEATITVDASKAADLKLLKRENFNDTTAPMSPTRLSHYFDGVQGSFSWEPRGPVKFDALTDIWWEARGAGASTEVSVDFDMILIAD